ncbi:unnamed protein product [Rhodiola kirilowii]
MASFDDFQTAICTSGGGWWNPGRSPFPFSPSAAPLTNFMWSDSSLNYIHDDQAEMKLQAATAATYSRSDDSSNDHNSSSALSSDYAQIFQHDQKLPQGADHFSASDWSQNTNLINQGFYNPGQFETTLQTLAGPGTDMNYDVFDSSFSATANSWPKMLLSPSPKQQLNGGTKQKHSNTNSSPNPFWDCWMGSDEIGTPALFEDQKPYNSCGSKEMAQKVATKRKTTTSDEMYKRPRIETPSSLPTFKVRKEKLGDRITALQQLVSPFGKTDTASVLHEAIEYIKLLHDQVLRGTPYMQNGASKNQPQQKQGESKSTASKQDLISRGLCLVPISSTFPVANEATSGFWTPTFGGTMTFR